MTPFEKHWEAIAYDGNGNLNIDAIKQELKEYHEICNGEEMKYEETHPGRIISEATWKIPSPTIHTRDKNGVKVVFEHEVRYTRYEDNEGRTVHKFN